MAGLYVHVPFCRSKCVYCDFYSLAIPHTRSRAHFIGVYLEALIREMSLRRPELPEAPQTFYLGGGSPSLLPISCLKQLVQAADRYFGLSLCTELTIEANPSDLTAPYFQALRALPFNRLSIGIQSFDDATLRFLRRRHNAAQARRAVERCRLYGFDNFSIDLIYGIPPDATPDDDPDEVWNRTIDAALALRPPHISAYLLTVEEGATLHRLFRQGLAPLGDDEAAEQFHLLRRRLLHAGYDHYELSNFALPDCLARHNTAYWDGSPYLGLGPAAHSFDGDALRSANPPDFPAYAAALAQGNLPTVLEHLTPRQRFSDYLITRLRTKWGIRPDEVRRLFGDEPADTLRRQAAPFLERGWLKQTAPTAPTGETSLCLSPSGMFLCDTILRHLI